MKTGLGRLYPKNIKVRDCLNYASARGFTTRCFQQRIKKDWKVPVDVHLQSLTTFGLKNHAMQDVHK